MYLPKVIGDEFPISKSVNTLGHSSGHHLCLLVLETFRSDPLVRIVRFLASLAFPVAVGWGT